MHFTNFMDFINVEKKKIICSYAYNLKGSLNKPILAHGTYYESILLCKRNLKVCNKFDHKVCDNIIK